MTLRELESQFSVLTPSQGTTFIMSIYDAVKSEDINTLQLITKLEKFVSEFRPEGRRICAMGDSMTREDRDMLTLHGRIVAALILVLHETHSVERLGNYTLLLLQYAAAVVRTKYDFLTTALDVICYKVTDPGIDWHIVKGTDSLDLLSFKLMEEIRFDKSVRRTFSYRGKGRVTCVDGTLSVCSSEAIESGAKAFSICGDRVGVFTRNVRDEKLKSAEQFDVASLRSFAETFLHVQEEGARRGAVKREYKHGEVVDIQIIGVSEDGESLECVIVDEDSEVRGTLNNDELIKGVWTEDLYGYFCELDCIRGAVLYKGADGNRFSIGDAYTAFARERAEADFRDNVCYQAKAYRVNQDWKRVNWMTPSGYGGITELESMPNVKEGDVAIFQVRNVQKQGANTYVNLIQPRYGADDVRPYNEEDILKAFVTTRDRILSEREKAQSGPNDKARDMIEVLGSILSNTAIRGSSIDAYRHLLVALFLYKMMGEQGTVERLSREAHYLGQSLSFAQGDKISLSRDVAMGDDKEAIIRLLSFWENPKDDIREEMLRWDADTIQGKVASLIWGVRMSQEYKDEIKVDREVVRKRICAILGVEDAFEAEGGLKKGKYGTVEGHEVEFKSSYVFRNDGKGADIDAQGRGEVFEAVCGFLNSDGGILYLGVNNQGDPVLSKDRGLEADKAWLQEHRLQINRDRRNKLGHNTLSDKIGEEGNLDIYVQFLNCEKELYFRDAFWGSIRIEVTADNDAIRINVDPAKYEIAYLYSDQTRTDGIAYVRDGGRTVPMSKVRKEQRLADLKRVAKEMGFVVTIQEAIDRHQRLIFKSYASGNSGEVRDRYVVPINLFYNDENVYCYDLESKTNKQFRLHRIGSIEYSEDTSSYTLPVSAPKQADVFRWIVPDGGRSYHVRLRMDVAAKNYLQEEYSCAEKLPKEEFYEEKKNKWILDTRVNGLGAVRRFYLGLADKIEILDTEDSEELKKAIAEFVEKSIMPRSK